MTVSARELAAQRRQQLFSEQTFETPLNGYEDLYAVRYRILTYEELRKIGTKNAKRRGLADEEREIVDAADTLIRACVGFVDISGEEPVPIEHTWTAACVRELFDADVPEDATARTAIRAVLPSTLLMLHFKAYDDHLDQVVPEVASELTGESESFSPISRISPRELPSLESTLQG